MSRRLQKRATFLTVIVLVSFENLEFLSLVTVST